MKPVTDSPSSDNEVWVPDTPPPKRRTLSGEAETPNRKKLRNTQYTLEGALSQAEYADAADIFIELYTDYTKTQNESQKVTPETFAKYYRILFEKLMPAPYQLEKIQSIAKAFIDIEEPVFCSLAMQGIWHANEAFLSHMNNAHERERSELIRAIDFITEQSNVNNDDIALQVQEYCVRIMDSSHQQEDPDALIRTVQEIYEIEKQCDSNSPLKKILENIIKQINTLALHLYADQSKVLLNYPLAEQNVQNWEKAYNHIIKTSVLPFENFDEFDRFIKTSLTELSFDKITQPNVYYHRMLNLNDRLFKLYQESKQLSPERKIELYTQIHGNLKSLLTEARGPRKASSTIINQLSHKMDVVNTEIAKKPVTQWSWLNRPDSPSSEISSESLQGYKGQPSGRYPQLPLTKSLK